MIRLVIDTNILISAVLTPEGLPARVVSLCLTDPDFEVCISAAVFAEYEEVMRRPKFKRSDREITEILQSILQESRWIRPSVLVSACPDPDDNVFLECAQAAEARYLITGNIKHFPMLWQRTQILTARQLLDEIA